MTEFCGVLGQSTATAVVMTGHSAKRPRILYWRIGRMVCNRRQLPFDFLYPYVAGLRGIGLYLLQTCSSMA